MPPQPNPIRRHHRARGARANVGRDAPVQKRLYISYKRLYARLCT